VQKERFARPGDSASSLASQNDPTSWGRHGHSASRTSLLVVRRVRNWDRTSLLAKPRAEKRPPVVPETPAFITILAARFKHL
jgi:hypothetical protein